MILTKSIIITRKVTIIHGGGGGGGGCGGGYGRHCPISKIIIIVHASRNDLLNGIRLHRTHNNYLIILIITCGTLGIVDVGGTHSLFLSRIDF